MSCFVIYGGFIAASKRSSGIDGGLYCFMSWLTAEMDGPTKKQVMLTHGNANGAQWALIWSLPYCTQGCERAKKGGLLARRN